VGDPAVGKSALVTRIRFDVFEQDIPTTVGALFTTVTWIDPNSEGEAIDFQFWDTAGSERYGSYIPQKLKSANVVLLLFDLSEPATQQSLEEWVALIRDRATKSPSLFLIGNKLDLEPRFGAQELATNYRAQYFEISAKTGDGVPTLLTALSKVPSDQVTMSTPLEQVSPPENACC
jgi:small GTP-binding protein